MKWGWLAALALVLSAPALAQSEDFESPPNSYDRAHAWRVEARVSTVYMPSIDDSATPVTVYPSGLGTPAVTTGPFGAVFGSHHRLLAEGEFDRDLWQRFGSAGVAIGLAYAEFYGTGFHNAGTTAAPIYVGSSDGTGFHVGQLRALGYYRFDYFVSQGIPVVPFVKAGFDWAYYWNTLSSGKLTPDLNGNGNSQGLVTGVEASLGVAFLLDFIDPVVARDMYRDLGVAHTYLNASYTLQDLQNGPSDVVHQIFNGGQAGPTTLNLSAGFFDFGVSVEF